MIRKKNVYTHYFHSSRRKYSNTTRIIPKKELPAAAYKPENVEKNKYDEWEREGLFTAQNRGDDPVFSMILPPPNVTGKLHLGHALTSTIQDVISRRKRSQGYNVLWLPGLDHAGIATQGVVEKYLVTTGVNPKLLERDKLYEEVWKWKEKYGHNIFEQLRTIGCSLDWTRQAFTMDGKHTRAVNTAFVELFKRGLIYRKKALVNWCNKLQSTVSDIEVENLSVKGPTDISVPGYDGPIKFGQLYSFAYKIFDSTEEIVVSTTMPETMLGDTAVAVHPKDGRYKHLVGKRAIHPFGDNTIPIIADDFVDMNLGTGAVKITPAHSKVDYDVGQRHHLQLLQVVDERGLIVNAGTKFDNVKKYVCRDIVLKSLEDLGLLREVESHEMTLPVCSRTGDVIEYLPKEQWFLSCSKLNEKAEKYVKDGILNLCPDKFARNWLNWTADNRDWCISRQLWWGHRIPAYRCTVEKNILWIASDDAENAKIEASKFLRTVPDEILAERDSDVLDTWFSSAIYPFASLGWPEDIGGADFKKFYPQNLLVTGHDILGFWVHRMVILGLELTGKLPFNNVVLHGIICDSRGAKMSKSKGNVIDPLDVVYGIPMEKLREKSEEMNRIGLLSKDELQKALAYHKANFSATNGIPQCGADALRFTLLSHDIKSHFVNFDVHMCNSNRLFCNKIWQSVKYVQISFQKLPTTREEISIDDLSSFDKWMLSKLANMVEKVNSSMDTYDFHLATKAIRTLIYNEFCDVYLEATKPGLDSDNVKLSFAHAHTLSAVLNTSLRSLSPFMIYLTQELIPKIPRFERNIIHNFNDASKKYFDFPQTRDFSKWRDIKSEENVDKVLNIINAIREVKGFYGITNKVRPSISINTIDEKLRDNIEENKAIVLHFTRGSVIKYAEEPNKKYVTGFSNENTNVSVEVVADDPESFVRAAKEKLHKRIGKIEEYLQKCEEKFSSNNYIENVPEWTKTLDKGKLDTKKQELLQLKRLCV